MMCGLSTRYHDNRPHATAGRMASTGRPASEELSQRSEGIKPEWGSLEGILQLQPHWVNSLANKDRLQGHTLAC